jgi:CSLREA domain-containing protein
MRLRTATVGFLVVLAAAFGAGRAAAASFTVNSTADGVGTCTPADCTLRAAVLAANAAPGSSTIMVPAGTYTLGIPGANEDAGLTGDLDVTKDLTIIGAGASVVTLNGAGLDRLLDVQGTGSLTLSGVRITGGSGSNGGGINSMAFGPTRLVISQSTIDNNSATNSGGGISSVGGVLTDVTVTNNAAPIGGGIATGSSTMTVTHSTISNNTAVGRSAAGGGIFNGYGVLIVRNSTINANTVTGTNGIPVEGGTGGGIATANGNASLFVDRSTISGNHVTDNVSNGGGISFNSAGTLAITNSTIAANNANQVGGVRLGFGIGSIVNSTITGNHATAAFGGAGGVMNNGAVGTTTLTIRNSTLSNNTPVNLTTFVHARLEGSIVQNSGAGNVNCDVPFAGSSVVSGGYNVVNDLTCALGGATDDRQGATVNALLGPLAANGGPTQTQVPGAGSPALDTIPTGGPCPISDQRGMLRPTTGNCDRGAVENTTSPVAVFIGAPIVAKGEGFTFHLNVAVTNLTGAPLASAGISLLSPATLTALPDQLAGRMIGTLAAGATDEETYGFTIPSACSATPFPFFLSTDAGGSSILSFRQFLVTGTGLCGGVEGTVRVTGVPVPNSTVELCAFAGGTCATAMTDGSGFYSMPNLAAGTYNVRAFPTASTPPNTTATTVPNVGVGTGTVLVNVDLELVIPIPPGVSMPSSVRPAANGMPVVGRGSPTFITIPGSVCSSGTPTGWTVQQGAATVASGGFGSGSGGTFQATLPAHTGTSGVALFAVICSSGPPVQWSFKFYDPSGTVRDSLGNPVAGATVTLLRADTPAGPFVALPDGDLQMSPENRTNPDLTSAEGKYAWDVVTGFSVVHVEKGGCSADSAVLEVPPPATNIDLVLACLPGTAAAPPAPPAPAPASTSTSTSTSTVSTGGGGGGGGSPAIVPSTAPAAQPPTVKNVPPQLTRTGKVVLQRAGRSWTVKGTVAVDEASTLRVQVIRPNGAAVTLAPGSLVGGIRSGKKRADIVSTGTGAFPIALHVTGLRPGRYVLVLTATDPQGASTKLSLPLQAH